MDVAQSATRAALLNNLNDLVNQLESYGADQSECRERRLKPDPSARSLSTAMPLGHACGAASFQSVVRDGRICSRETLERRGIVLAGGNTERTLGTAGDVFTYVGPLRYPGTSCGFLLNPVIERRFTATALATPFDSGAIHKFGSHMSAEDQVAFLRRHQMPVPEYREYFWRYLVFLFKSARHYVDGTGPDLSGPVRLESGDTRRWTFEVRFASELPLAGSLVTVILPVALAASMSGHVVEWRRAGVQVRYYQIPDPGSATNWALLYDESVRCLNEIL
jgi:hypothetical protein